MAETREQEVEVRRLLYAELQDQGRIAAQLQGDHGKWLIASLLLVHGAAFGFVAQNDRLATTLLPHVYWWHVAGLVLALVCGFAAWANWGLHLTYVRSVDVTKLYDLDEKWPLYDQKAYGRIDPTYWLSIVAGIGSACCILGSAAFAWCRLI